jgi:hypothetical protein
MWRKEPLMFTDQTQKLKTMPSDTKGALESQKQFLPNVNVAEFLRFVAEGEQDKAEAMLKTNKDLALVAGNVTDHAKRIFRNITGFQYAVWALDWHMWKMIRKYLPDEVAQEQAKGFGIGAWVKEYGEYASWKKLLDAQQTLKNNWNEWDWKKIDEHWMKIGELQLMLPMHVLQEYNQPNRPFDPCPKFNNEYDLERNLPDWLRNGVLDGSFSLHWRGSKKENRSAVCRGRDVQLREGVCDSHNGPFFRVDWAHIMLDGWEKLRAWMASSGWFDGVDMNALCELSSVRTQQRQQLLNELIPSHSNVSVETKNALEKPVQPKPPVTLKDASSQITSTNPLLQSLQVQLVEREQQNSTSSLSQMPHTPTDIQTLDTLVHDLQETEKEKQALEQTSSKELKAHKRIQETLQKEITIQKSEYALLEQQQVAFEKQIADLEKSLAQKSGVEQQEAETHLKALQEQLLIVQNQQAILWNEHAIKVQKREALKRFQSHP